MRTLRMTPVSCTAPECASALTPVTTIQNNFNSLCRFNFPRFSDRAAAVFGSPSCMMEPENGSCGEGGIANRACMRGQESVTLFSSIRGPPQTAHACAVCRKGNTVSDQTEAQGSLAAGTWIGREQAFNAVAHHCSAARAACLKHVRDTGAYQSLNLTWDQFCPEHAGISRSQADRLISQLTEFGAPFFQ